MSRMRTRAPSRHPAERDGLQTPRHRRGGLALLALLISLSPIAIIATFAVHASLTDPDVPEPLGFLAIASGPAVALVLVHVSKLQIARAGGEQTGLGLARAAKLSGLLVMIPVSVVALMWLALVLIHPCLHYTGTC